MLVIIDQRCDRIPISQMQLVALVEPPVHHLAHQALRHRVGVHHPQELLLVRILLNGVFIG
jgi:hypothetical protein